DSGKRVLVDIPSGHNSFVTQASTGNLADPPARISVGQVTDEAVFDDFYPSDMVVRFNNNADVTPPERNFSVLEKSTGRVLLANQRYVQGGGIEVAGVRFAISG